MIEEVDATNRSSHVEFMEARDWSVVSEYWKNAIVSTLLPEFLFGTPPFSVTDLKAIHDASQSEFRSKDPRFKRQTFALQIGYDGEKYSGYQMQRGQGVHTVEDDLKIALGGRTCVAAGRTDKGVSAVSQIISFNTFDDIDADRILSQFRESEACRQGHLAVWQCYRVPRKFHALFTATWRRYVYLFPLNRGDFNGYDVDVDFVQRCFSELEGKELPFDNFAYRETRNTGSGSSDLCTLFKLRASVHDLSNQSTAPLPGPALCVELVGTRFLRRMVRILVATAVRESVLPSSVRKVTALLDICLGSSRSAASLPAPSAGLALGGVGYDISSLTAAVAHHPVLDAGAADSSRRSKRKQDVADLTSDASTKIAGLSEGTIACDDAKSDSAVKSGQVSDTEGPSAGAMSELSTGTSTEAACVNTSIGFQNVARTAKPVVMSDAWTVFSHELVSFDSDKVFFPERAFSFSVAGEFVVAQNAGDVGTIVWDAEVILAHLLDGRVSAGERILELGAGTALAAAVCHKNHAEVVVQELAHVLPHTMASLRACGVETGVQAVAGQWGECVTVEALTACGASLFDRVVMGDVLYHTEDFSALVATIDACAKPVGASVLVVAEQRRKMLDVFVDAMLPHFPAVQSTMFRVPSSVDSRVTDFLLWTFTR